MDTGIIDDGVVQVSGLPIFEGALMLIGVLAALLMALAAYVRYEIVQLRKLIGKVDDSQSSIISVLEKKND